MFRVSSIPRHRVFISFHHALDEQAKQEFVGRFASAFDDHSVRPGDIDDTLSVERIRQKIRDEYIRDATVTIVLVGRGTWRRKHVDWEIDSSLRHTTSNSRTGLLGVLLPSYRPIDRYNKMASHTASRYTTPPREQFSPNNVPPRLWDNVEAGFASMRPYPSSVDELATWIDEAFTRRDKTPYPNLARSRFADNRADDRVGWE